MSNRTYLELCNDLSREAGVSGSASAITAVASQSGEALRIVNWIKQSYKEIQSKHDCWRWMRSKWTVSATVGDGTYAGTDCTDSRLSAAITRFAHWIPFDDNGASNVRIYLTSGGVSGERYMVPLPWNNFTAIYSIGTQNNSVPVHFSIDPQNNLVLGPLPDGTYTLGGEYQMSAKIFSADADTAEFPERFDDLIWLWAMKKYGAYHAAPEVLARWDSEGVALMRMLEANQLPALGMGEPLA